MTSSILRKVRHQPVGGHWDSQGMWVVDYRPCRSATCRQRRCQDLAVGDRVKALRFVCRGDGVSMLTVNNLPSPEAVDEVHHELLRLLRKQGFSTEAATVVEPHRDTTVVHAHMLIRTAASDEDVRRTFDGMRPRLGLPARSVLHLGGHANSTYVLKNYLDRSRVRGARVRHLLLNGGRLFRRVSQNFWHTNSIERGGWKACLVAENARSKAWGKLAELVGPSSATEMTQDLLRAQAILRLVALEAKAVRGEELASLAGAPWLVDFVTGMEADLDRLTASLECEAFYPIQE